MVKGDGKGTITNDPKDITVFADGIPILVSNLNGETGKFMTQQIPPVGTDLRVDYYFKRQDTLITNEDISAQVPTYATYALQTGLNISLSMPGASGNKVALAFTKATTVANAKSDALAVSGVGSNNISIEISKVVLVSGTPTVATRTIAEIKNLIEAGIPTLSGGFLTATLAQGADPSALISAGPSSTSQPGSLWQPLAAGVLFPFTGWLLSPMIAALAMSLSSASVITNALRLRGGGSGAHGHGRAGHEAVPASQKA